MTARKMQTTSGTGAKNKAYFSQTVRSYACSIASACACSAAARATSARRSESLAAAAPTPGPVSGMALSLFDPSLLPGRRLVHGRQDGAEPRRCLAAQLGMGEDVELVGADRGKDLRGDRGRV